ncbi:MAG: sensor histidine kinase [Succinivibrio sp.]
MESRKRKFLRSLRFKLCLTLAVIGIVFTALSCYRSYNKAMTEIELYVDEELTQISNVIIDYNVILPKSWNGPEFKRRVLSDAHGHIVVSESRVRNTFMPAPSLKDLFIRHHQDIIVAPLHVQPGHTYYFPSGIEDGIYSVLINNRRVRALVGTNRAGIRFVVARSFELIEALVSQALKSSIIEFLLLIAIYIPAVILFVNFIFIPVNKLAHNLNQRRESDLTPVKGHHLPSELDIFIDSMNNMFARIDKSLQNERRFVADAAHEMRTPLTAISLQAQSLDENAIPKDEADKVRELKTAITRQRVLTNNLLEYARSQCGRQLVRRSFDMRSLFIEVIDELGSLADKKDIDLGLVSDCKFSLYSDRARVKSVVSNLVSNALKYTPDGGQCDLNCESDGKTLIITVEDTGPGIPKENLAKVFNAFYRVGGDTAKIEGTGLGLAIVKSTCDELNASVTLSNRLSGGLKAEVRIPQYY